jgi:hypothetical protein
MLLYFSMHLSKVKKVGLEQIKMTFILERMKYKKLISDTLRFASSKVLILLFVYLHVKDL